MTTTLATNHPLMEPRSHIKRFRGVVGAGAGSLGAMGAPTVADARRAASALADAGASRVLLFGSVAGGTAGERSDIDLVAIFDDIDYADRYGLRAGLSDVAGAAAGHPVEVFVTDRPEWRRRSRDVSASFEAGIAPGSVVLVERPAGSVRWNKEIGLPASNIDEALGRLDEATKALNLMRGGMLPDEWEAEAAAAGDARAEEMTNWRMMDVCSAGAVAVETSLKALAAAAGRAAPRGHHIHLLVPLAGSRGDRARAALAALEANTVATEDHPFGDVTIWRQAGTYIADRPDIALGDTARLAPLIARAAVDLAAVAADAAGEHPSAARARRYAARIAEVLAGRDLLTGADLGPEPPDPGLDLGP
ncbi:MAG: nucleotidyltransferase domain-containing protein [bacterium]|nr:nucleotidyltransferase domain-containing protein [bacterium]